MAGFVRTKRVTDPLDARVRDRLVGRDGSELGYASSGSEHSAEDDSPCLSELVHGFLEDASEPETRANSDQHYDSDSERADSVSNRVDLTECVLRSTGASNADSYRKLLLAHVSQAVETFSRLRSNKPVFRRNVMSFLRDLGHNAAICKSRWDSSSGSLTAGAYEFIDAVLKPSSAAESRRYFVDLDFAAEFEIARPSAHYSRLLQSLPRVFVGSGDELKRIVRAMCDAARRSLKSTELSVPPWRKNRYMQNKWFGPYRRTVNPAPETATPSSITTVSVAGVKCRRVGFDNGVADGNVNVGRAFVRIR
ncbi:hypothetical protein TorRG33x02_334390 [Trema orientale]|uniref:DUF506 family protein n=1 Tax=Trema orientale TaxID=63057 RepID=A0A2P5B2T0_TREOI|nr:hypothetical protein TorRG33x02_334390 [Trema orientale]